MNRRAFGLALQAALALNCEIPEFTKWDRKQYYYPDLPKGYQISQYDLPMSQKGWLEIHDPKGRFQPKKVGIIRAHLEEDAGKSLHEQETGKKFGDPGTFKQTRGWDDAKGITFAQREKEESSDYRYFPDPDLCPVVTPAAKVDEVRRGLTELPAAI